MNKSRVQHVLKPMFRTELPSNLIFVDTETKGVAIDPTTQKHTLWFGWACHVHFQKSKTGESQIEKWIRFDTAAGFWDWLESCLRSRTRTWLFAHNWNFDAAILCVGTIPLERGWVCQKYINNRPPVIISLRRDDRTLFLIDSLNYFPFKLEKLGQDIGIPKLPMPDPEASQSEWDTYAKQDVLVMKTAILKLRQFVKDNDLGSFKPTLAGQAFVAFRHKYMSVPILIHDRKRVSKLEREGYFGGRVECYKQGEVKGPLYLMDVNSLYPSVMAANDFPHVLVDDYKGGTEEKLTEALENHSLISTVTITTDTPIYPLYDGERLQFPIGEFVTTLTTPELSIALQRGDIMTVHYTAKYLQTNLFADYVQDLYSARLEFRAEKNEAFDLVAKLLLNALYGKFGQRLGKWEERPDIIAPDVMEWIEADELTGIIHKFRIRMGVVQQEMSRGEAYDSFPAISAHVTAFGRLALWKLITTAGRRNVYYCDTDSVVTNKRGFDRLESLVDPLRLGALKHEGTFQTGAFYAPKHYTLGKRVKIKGIRHNARHLGNNLYEQERFVSWDWLHGKGEDGYILIKTIRKQLSVKYRKGTVLASGRIVPLELHV